MDSELEEWLTAFAAAAQEAARTFAEGWPPGEPLPDPSELVNVMASAYNTAVDLARMLDDLETTVAVGSPTGPRE